MRTVLSILVALLLVSLPTLGATTQPETPELGEWDWDALRAADTPQKLLLEAARVGGWPAPAPHALDAAPETLADALAELYAARAAAGLAEAPPLDALPVLDPAVERPLAGLVSAMARAVEHWGFSRVDLTAADRAVLADDDADPMAQLEAARKIRGDHMLAAALLVLDAADVYSPQLKMAAEAGVWPAEGFVDPAGVVELGTMGADHFSEDRWLLVDPGGNDTWDNNAGGSKVVDKWVAACTPVVVICARYTIPHPEYTIPIALAIDQGGDDFYTGYLRMGRVQGAGSETVGVLREEGGNDTYLDCWLCQGYGEKRGVGLLHEMAGDDSYGPDHSGAMGSGYSYGFGLLVDEGGNDTYHAKGFSKGWGMSLAIGVFREFSGKDAHSEDGGGNYGGGSYLPFAGVGLYYDTGGHMDDYGPMAAYPPYPGNNKTWQGSDGPLGFGRDE